MNAPLYSHRHAHVSRFVGWLRSPTHSAQPDFLLRLDLSPHRLQGAEEMQWDRQGGRADTLTAVPELPRIRSCDWNGAAPRIGRRATCAHGGLTHEEATCRSGHGRCPCHQRVRLQDRFAQLRLREVIPIASADRLWWNSWGAPHGLHNSRSARHFYCQSISHFVALKRVHFAAKCALPPHPGSGRSASHCGASPSYALAFSL